LVLSLALVIEEGLSFEVLDRVVDSIQEAAKEAEVSIATGDTKVVERQRGDGLIITTTGVGELLESVRLGSDRILPGDGVIITGPIAEHGLAVMSAREDLGLETRIMSDVAPLTSLVEILFHGDIDVKFMRDPTRGGLAGVLADLVEDTGLGLEITERAVPVSAGVRHMAELLGLDPFTVANEGKIVVVVSESDMEGAVDALRSHPLGRHAACIGRFVKEDPPLVEMITEIGGRRILQRPYGEDLPRIC
jgi:hydrogenase expression/formation protein HypE